ncbi:MAG: hypothetical protein SRB2_01997 [Desulfobacteraceae bacterium Eth-SRB2]|nr:MAG: hypothetical protein SRB2_01997 [Desulfobacteraceae bacterium Eth-SRB2]
MTQKPTYEELEQKVKELEKETVERNRVEKALREKENFLKIVFNAIQDGISVRDQEFNLTLVNQWMEKKYASQKPLVGKKCYTVFQKRNSICPWCPAVLAMKTGEMFGEIVPYPCHDDPAGWFDVTAFPVRDLNGEIVGCIEHVRDVTERKKTDEALKKS